MGVEYCHGVVVEDLSWIPSLPAIERVLGVCAKWKLADEFDILAEPDDRRETWQRVSTKVGVARSGLANADLPLNSVFVAKPAPSGEPVARVMGSPDLVGFPDSNRYLQTLSLVFGLDFQVFPRSETLHCEATTPPLDATHQAVSGRGFEDEEDVVGASTVFLCPPAVHPPTISASWRERGSTNDYVGCFRSGVILNCGKNLVAGLTGQQHLSNEVFVADLEEAFGTALSQFGYFH